MASSSAEIADILLKSGCLRFGDFKIKSGASSPYYIDLAGLFAYPEDLCSIANLAAERIKRIAASDKVDRLASIELRGALLLMSVACYAGLPCAVVRKETKSYGMTGRIVGTVYKNDHILFFDDVISQGQSKLEAIKQLEEIGAKVQSVVVIVNREQGGKETLENKGYKVHALTNISDIVNSLTETDKISKKQAQEILNYIKKP